MNRYVIAGGMLIALLAAGCAGPSVTVGGYPQAISLNFDARDYNEVAKKLYDSLVQAANISSGKVVALKPVTGALEGGQVFDGKTLQEKLQVLAIRSGRLKFCYAAESVAGNDATTDRSGSAACDYYLFGRVSSQTTCKDSGTEVTFTLNWKLGDCKTGLLVWTDETEITKRAHR